MARWLIVLTALTLWITCMAAVYNAYRPHQAQPSNAGTEANLDALFDEQAQPVNAWKIYVDPVRLKEALPDFADVTPGNNDSGTRANRAEDAKSHKPWDGVDEHK